MLDQKPAFAEGKNYRFDLDDGIAWCRVWARLDLDRDVGALLAKEKIAVFARLVEMPRRVVRACLFDLREAPVSWGPVTQAALEQSVALWERAARRIALLTSGDALQCLHVRLLVKQQAPTHGKHFTVEVVARDWLVH